jgi:aerobic-type carbon monoxide dehydrogenase small subunit (CoxS/CutS family)
MSAMRPAFQLNGEPAQVDARGDEVLIETLRRLGLTSVRGTCGIGVCGTCSVLVDGRAVSACLTLTAGVAGRTVQTAEGMTAPDGTPGPVQQAFLDNDAFQCSYCIPAMTIMVSAYLAEHDEPTVEGAREYLQGNLCRCGTYPEILQAVASLVQRRPPPQEDSSS